MIANIVARAVDYAIKKYSRGAEPPLRHTARIIEADYFDLKETLIADVTNRVRKKLIEHISNQGKEHGTVKLSLFEILILTDKDE